MIIDIVYRHVDEIAVGDGPLGFVFGQAGSLLGGPVWVGDGDGVDRRQDASSLDLVVVRAVGENGGPAVAGEADDVLVGIAHLDPALGVAIGIPAVRDLSAGETGRASALANYLAHGLVVIPVHAGHGKVPRTARRRDLVVTIFIAVEDNLVVFVPHVWSGHQASYDVALVIVLCAIRVMLESWRGKDRIIRVVKDVRRRAAMRGGKNHVTVLVVDGWEGEGTTVARGGRARIPPPACIKLIAGLIIADLRLVRQATHPNDDVVLVGGCQSLPYGRNLAGLRDFDDQLVGPMIVERCILNPERADNRNDAVD